MIISGKAFPSRATPYLMGVVNATPDSFFDGRPGQSPEILSQHALRLAAEGADILDIGGESTRPGSEPVNADEELRRVLPVIRAVRPATEVPLSIDTCKSGVAGRALDEGVGLVNDVTAMTFDPHMTEVVKAHGAAVVLMHMQGTPKTMQENPRYQDPVREIGEYLLHRAAEAEQRGIAPEKIILDPGIGFGKRLEDNLALLKDFAGFIGGRYPVLIGHSRKSFIGRLLQHDGDRFAGSLGAALAAAFHGAGFIRTHDVRATREALAVFNAVRGAALQTEPYAVV